MRPITMYEANDGSRWNTEAEALRRDALIVECEAVADDLGLRPAPDTTDFANGDGYVQQPQGSRERLIDTLRELGANRDSDGPIGRLLNRAWRIDEQDREWGQPYFALNPTKGRQVEVATP